MRILVTAMLLIAGIIHILAFAGAAGPDKLAMLYGLDFQDPTLAVLMRHRAVVLGLVGVLMAWAAFRPPLQGLALGAGLANVIAFLGFAWLANGYNAALGKVVVADAVALACLLVGLVARLWAGRAGAVATA